MLNHARTETLHELLLLRDEYVSLTGEAHTRDEIERVHRMIRELSGCIERLQQELSRASH